MSVQAAGPFTYSTRQWAAIRRELPSLPATPRAQLWSTIGARRIPLIVGSGEVRPRDPKRGRTMLERTARQFLAFEVASCRRHDAAAAERRAFAAERRAFKEASRALRRAAALLAGIPDMAAAAGVIAQVAAVAQTRATPSRGGRRADDKQPWLVQELMFIWEQFGGATRTSTRGCRNARRGGPLVRFLVAACDPLFQACNRKAPTHDAMRGAVRKLPKERTPQPR